MVSQRPGPSAAKAQTPRGSRHRSSPVGRMRRLRETHGCMDAMGIRLLRDTLDGCQQPP
eukprot:CAMPEP_0197872474 /NCGR_PEP_ID=MMETSP1439-20131203/2582_1 /TAXON_ID=66791 /ORGANISM="Gonyaulax spinifera, Strain CCMP409" /LENGTH=58 /DNA_ID=CAMNT_0043491473 /DNA_START=70 /DNA_END=243 /DNA_ORIENTATION=+